MHVPNCGAKYLVYVFYGIQGAKLKMNAEEFLQNTLQLQDGDILFADFTFEDEDTSNYDRDNIVHFEPRHTMMWLKDHVHPIAHSVREGYHLPGIRLTKIPEGQIQIFRSINTTLSPEKAAKFMRNWSLSSKLYAKEDYQKTFPLKFWEERHSMDIQNFYCNSEAKVSGPATPYLEPRATFDLCDLSRNPNLIIMEEEGLRRAIKFASRQNVISPEPISKGQRCTPTLVAAYQASVLMSIVKLAKKSDFSFKQYKDLQFEKYADEVLIEGWRDTACGKKLLAARSQNNYIELFTAPFALNQRYATPKNLYELLQKSKDYNYLGMVNYKNSYMEITNSEGKTFEQSFTHRRNLSY